jgi:hypothetical protein
VLAHIVNGILVLSLVVVMNAYGLKLKVTQVSRLSVRGLFFCDYSGFTFTLSGQDDGFSMGMASFPIVYTVYLTEFYVIGRVQVAQQEK